MNPEIDKPVRPPRLKPGDTIGIVAPAGPFDHDLFMQGLSALQSMGFRTRVPDAVFDKTGYLAGSDAQRARLVNQLFKETDVQAIVCARGGFGCLRMLPLVDFDIIGAHPKVFVGFSDITALLAAITRRSGLVTFHGPMVTPLATASELTLRSLSAAITSDIPLEIAPAAGVVLQAGRATGPVIGGNLATLCHLLGTPFEAGFEDNILLLEDRGEAPYRIDRMLSQMKLAGSFKGIAGIILGSFKDCGNLDDIYRIFQDRFQDLHIPILAGFDVGHGKQNLTLPVGMTATLDTDLQLLSFTQPATTG
ncbi:MAG: LD-carboxypeptidase [Desulfobacterales bacterium]|jgi:muramoyltetrapeptide carboxypeptidase